ncbi:MAG: glycoside hydrolase family 5 protein [Chloroflexota bacterium]|nr:MAG: glycoside hydrolase family 5 protein [Chloroflexota bacterium]
MPIVRRLSVLAGVLLVLSISLGVVPLRAPIGGSHPALAAGPGLYTAGSRILDATGREVRLTGVNWFGLETCNFAPHGLWSRSWKDLLDVVTSLGSNVIRLPYSNQLFDSSSIPNGIDFYQNPDLKGMSGLQIMDTIISGAAERGIAVILDRHRPDCGAQSNLWYTDKVSEDKWISDWRMLARRYKGNPAVVGADLHNEPHGGATWGSGDIKTDWRLAAERAGNAILEENSDWLIIVEGIDNYRGDSYWWGGNLKGVQDAPVRLKVPDRVVYSAHDYGPGVSGQSWFSASDFPRNMPKIWDEHWGYIVDKNIAPVLMGEFGGRSLGSDTEGTWQRSLFEYLRTKKINYTYWSLNPNSGDTGGVLLDDWKTLNTGKQALLSADRAPSFISSAALTAAPAGSSQPSPSAAASSSQPAGANLVSPAMKEQPQTSPVSPDPGRTAPASCDAGQLAGSVARGVWEVLQMVTWRLIAG